MRHDCSAYRRGRNLARCSNARRANLKRQGKLVAGILLVLLSLIGCGPPTTLPPTAVPPSPTPEIIPSPLPTATAAATAPPSAVPAPPLPLGLVRLWRTATGDTIWDMGSTDVQPDGRPEVWVASYDHSFYLITATGGISWSFATAGPVYTGQAADLEGDGRPEFLLGGDDNALHALSSNGAERWVYPAGGRVTHLATGDVDGDGRLEALATTWDSWLHILDVAGVLENRISLQATPTALATMDLNGDGTAEVLVGLEDGQVLALNAGGKLLWQHGLEGAVRGLVTGDLDGAGDQEVLAGSRDGLIVLIGANGEPRWARRVEGTVVSLAGLATDRRVLVGLANGIVALDATNGFPVWHQAMPKGIWTMAILGGAEPVLAAGTDGGEIVLLNRAGQVRGKLELPSRVHGLLWVDLDRDGRPELLARSGDYLYAFQTAAQGEAGEPAPTVVTLPRWPEPSPLPPLPEGHISLAAVGDIMLGRSIEERMQAYGTLYPFQALAPLLQQADIAIGNLECVLAQEGDPAAKPFVFRAHPTMAAGLAEAGFDVLNVANNHTLDYGPAGLTDTLSTLEDLGIRAVGAGVQGSEPAVVEVRGVRVAFLARNAAGPPQAGVAWALDEQSLRQDIQQARLQADILVLLLHTGWEYQEEITPEQRQLAQAAVQAGANLVIGYHRYYMEDTEPVGTGFIAYGLGDFTFDIDIVDEARDGALLWVVLTQQGIARVDWIPTRTVDDVQPHPRVAPGGRVEMEPLLVQTSEPLPPAPTPRSTYILSATVSPETGQVQVREQLLFPNATGDVLKDVHLFVYPNAVPGTFALQNVVVVQEGQEYAPSTVLAATDLHLFLSEPLSPGLQISLSLDYSLSLPPLDPAALPPAGNVGRSEDGRSANLGHWYPQVVPYRRGYGWQTWDYYPVGDPWFADPADYRVSVEAPAGYTVFGGGERQQQGQRWSFALDAARDFGTVVARDYVEASGEAGGVSVVSAYRREHELAGQAVLKDTVQALTLYQQRYGPYPYLTYTVVEGDLGGGMEYGGMSLLGSPFYSSYQGLPTATLPAMAVHELAHQWWYNVVGNDQANEPWLDEALATYSELLYYQEAYSKSVDWWWANRIDSWAPSGPVDASIYDFPDTAAFVHNVYGQAAHFMQDLRLRLGDEAFFTFLERYYREYAWQRVTRRDFFRLLEKTGVSVEDLVRVYFK